MDTLSYLLASRVKAELLRLLFGMETRELHLRELARQAGLNDATVRQEIRRMSGLCLVVCRRDGNRTYYRANRDHQLYPELHGLVLKTSGLADVVRGALGIDGIRVAFIFGSLANGNETPMSDVDLMVVGSMSLRQLAPRVASVADHLGREVNPHLLTPEEFVTRRGSGDHFLTSVMAAPKIFVIGDENELEKLGRKQVAASPSDQPPGDPGFARHRRSRPRRRG